MKTNLTLIFVSLLLFPTLTYSQNYPIPSNYIVKQQVNYDFDRDGNKDLCVYSENKIILLFLSRDFKKTKTFQKYEIDDTGNASLFVKGDTLQIHQTEGMSAVIEHYYDFYYDKKLKTMVLTKCNLSITRAISDVIAEIDISTQTYHIKYRSEEKTFDITEKYTDLPVITFKNLQENNTKCRQLIMQRLEK